MSKQSQAKKEQGYRQTGPSCGNCDHFQSEQVPIKWMLEENARNERLGLPTYYDMKLPANNKESNLRCSIGDFSIKKMAYCLLWIERP